MAKEVIFSNIQEVGTVYSRDGILTVQDLLNAAEEHFGITEREDYNKLFVGSVPFCVEGKIRVCMILPRTDEVLINKSVATAEKVSSLIVEYNTLADVYSKALYILNEANGFERIKIYPANRFGSLLLVLND